MLHTFTTRLSIAAALALTACGTLAANVGLDVNSASNGLTKIYSATFDGGLSACGGGSSTYCTFFGGDPGGSNNVTSTPNPSGVKHGVPGGIGPTNMPAAPVPASGSYLDLTLSSGNTQLTLNTSSITFKPVDVCITAPGCALVSVHATDAGIVLSSQPAIGGALTPAGGGSTGTVNVPVDGNGVAVFEVQNLASVVADFSQFSQIVGTSCTGSACALITGDVLNLDVIRYVLIVDYDPTFTSFTATFVGETTNQSLLYLTLNSATPDADSDGVADSVDNCPSTANQDQADNDTDGRGNMCDNCRSVANNTGAGAQCDSDGDGFGNRCDGDFINPAPGNGVTNSQDYAFFRSHLGIATTPPVYDVADLNCNGTVNSQDYAVFRTLLGSAPGPGAGP